MKISICIPTYKRPDLLEEALASCLAQTLLPSEIIIGDNSPDTTTQDKVAQLAAGSKVPITYVHHVPGLTPAQNVANLFSKVTTELLLLLHDDDVLLTTCLHDLANCFAVNSAIDAAFGKQYLMSFKGDIDYAGSERWNQLYYKTSEYARQPLSSVESAILQQFPNNSYLVRSSLAQSIGYDELSTHACDFEFGLRLALRGHHFHFIDTYTTKARLSATSLSRNYDNNGGLVIYRLVKELYLPSTSSKYQTEVLSKYAPVALAQSANLKIRAGAREIFFAKWHWNTGNIYTIIKGVYHLVRAHL
jgi:glycosyltransferase involved in cell wall biosynthesis